MNKKFLSAILFGALMVTSTGTFVSCKDYDDDIDNLQTQVDANKAQIDNILAAINGKKFISDYVAVTNGYQLNFSDGSSLTISNGAAGAQGEQGIQGVQGPQGEAGATIIPKFKVDAENYWMVSVDDGATYEYVLNEAGNKIKATGAAGENASTEDIAEAVGNLIYVDDEGYINIGENRTAFKYNASIPSLIYNEKDQTMKVTIDGQEYTLLMEGSAFNGLQSISFRKPYADNSTLDYGSEMVKVEAYYWNKVGNDWKYVPVEYGANADIEDSLRNVITSIYLGEKADVAAYQLYLAAQYGQGGTKKDTLFAAIPGKASFKVWPNDFSLTDAEFAFTDSYKARAAAPTFVAKNPMLENGILTVDVLTGENISDYTMYMTSLDVTMYDQYTSASDYFSVKTSKLSQSSIAARHTARYDWGYPRPLDYNNSFVYTESYNLNDSIDAYLMVNEYPELSTVGLEYEQTFKLVDEEGIFELNNGILTVAEKYQSSAINEWAHVEITTTVKSQVEGVHDIVRVDEVYIQAVREAAAPTECKTIEIEPLKSIALTYSDTKTQVIPLNLRAFQDAIGGRDVLMRMIKGTEFTDGWAVLYAAYPVISDNKVTGYNDFTYPHGSLNPDKIETTFTSNGSGVGFIYKQVNANNSSNTSLDSLFLVVGPKTQLAATDVYINRYYGTCDNLPTFYYDIHAKLKGQLSVTRDFEATVKEEYSAMTIIGKWSEDKKTYELASTEFDKMYTLKPADAKVAFAIDAAKQNDYVKSLIKEGKLTFVNNIVAFTAPVDVAKVKEIKVDLYDTSVAKDNFYRTDTWKVQSPLKDFTGFANLGKYYNPTLAKNTTVDVLAYAATITKKSADGKKDVSVWSDLKLNDYIAQTVVQYSVNNKKFIELATAEGLYRTDSKSTGLEFSTKTEGWTIDKTTGVLTCTIDPTGTIYTKTVTVTVSYKHDWGTTSFDFTIEVIRDAKP